MGWIVGTIITVCIVMSASEERLQQYPALIIFSGIILCAASGTLIGAIISIGKGKIK